MQRHATSSGSPVQEAASNLGPALASHFEEQRGPFESKVPRRAGPRYCIQENLWSSSLRQRQVAGFKMAHHMW